MSTPNKPQANYSPEYCAWCKGKGTHILSQRCPVCNGQGTVLVAQPAHPCETCRGSGKGMLPSIPCQVCGGSGWAHTNKG